MGIKVLALTKDGNMTYCTASPKERGKRRCNHIAHQKDNESQEQFIDRISSIELEDAKTEALIKIEEETSIEIAPYRMSEEEKSELTEILGRKQLADETCEGGYIHLDTPLWNDMDKKYFAKMINRPVSTLNKLINKEIMRVTYVGPNCPKKHKVGNLYKHETAMEYKNQLGDEIEFNGGVKALNDWAAENDFEATKDVYVLPYYLRQDPPETEAKHPLNSLYNYLIIKRKDPDQQQLAYENLIDNKSSIKPLKGAGGYAMSSLADMLNGKSGYMRAGMSGRSIPYSGRALISPDIDQEYGSVKLPPIMICKIFRPSIENHLIRHGHSYEEINDFLGRFEGSQREIHPKDRETLNEIIKDINPSSILNRQPSLHRSSLLSFKTSVSPDNTIKINPLNVEGYAADFDGDQMSVYGINNSHISELADKSIGAKTETGTRLGRNNSHSIIMPQKEALWGLLNILDKRDN